MFAAEQCAAAVVRVAVAVVVAVVRVAAAVVHIVVERVAVEVASPRAQVQPGDAVVALAYGLGEEVEEGRRY